MPSISTPSSRAEAEAFPHLPESARLWIFGVSRPLTPQEETRLLERVDDFLEGWKAHGHPLSAARDWRYGRFLLVAVDDRITPPSGCSIDALVRELRVLEGEFAAEIVGGAPVWFREEGPDGPIRRVSRAEFRQKVRDGEVGPDTVVFDLSLTRVDALRAGNWELPARSSWHARYFDD
jgi:hypothetical protein